MGKLDRKDAAAAADKKLRRLDMLLIKINSAVEASEKHAIENASLVKWRDRLKEAAAEGGEVLASFRQRETEAAAPAQATGDGDDAQAQQHQHQQDSSSSSSSSTASATATKTLLFSSEEDMERLNYAVERLEDLSCDISIFIKLLKLEILAPAPALTFAEDIGFKRLRSSPARSNTGDYPPPFKTSDSKLGALPELAGAGQIHMGPSAAAAAQAAGEGSMLLGRLQEAVATICRIVELADGRDLSGYEWLAYWAYILREAKCQGCAVLGAISTVAVAVDEVEVARCDDQDDFELGRFVRNMESLAREADSFSDLACLCPTARCTSYLARLACWCPRHNIVVADRVSGTGRIRIGSMYQCLFAAV